MDIFLEVRYLLVQFYNSMNSLISQIMILNRDCTSDMGNFLSSITSQIKAWFRSSNSYEIALNNVRMHYDLSNEIFEAFLSPDMTYSCPKWQLGQAGLCDTLEQAQLRKIRDIIAEAKLKQSDYVLEIGTGWGSFAIEAVRRTGCKILSITLSEAQKTMAEARVKEAGLQNNITILLKDYRELSGSQFQFDKIVSIEMLEHVGKEHLTHYFSCIHKLLKPKQGIAVFQASTIPETVSHYGVDYVPN